MYRELCIKKAPPEILVYLQILSIFPQFLSNLAYNYSRLQDSFTAVFSSHAEVCYNCKCKFFSQDWMSNMPEF